MSQQRRFDGHAAPGSRTNIQASATHATLDTISAAGKRQIEHAKKVAKQIKEASSANRIDR